MKQKITRALLGLVVATSVLGGVGAVNVATAEPASAAVVSTRYYWLTDGSKSFICIRENQNQYTLWDRISGTKYKTSQSVPTWYCLSRIGYPR